MVCTTPKGTEYSSQTCATASTLHLHTRDLRQPRSKCGDLGRIREELIPARDDSAYDFRGSHVEKRPLGMRYEADSTRRNATAVSSKGRHA